VPGRVRRPEIHQPGIRKERVTIWNEVDKIEQRHHRKRHPERRINPGVRISEPKTQKAIFHACGKAAGLLDRTAWGNLAVPL
jgi:hypothetical protein